MESTRELLVSMADDVKEIARDEVALARNELLDSVRSAAAKSAALLLGATVALLGLGILCTAAVVVAGAWIPSLALRLVLMAMVYVALGAAVVAAVKEGVQHA